MTVSRRLIVGLCGLVAVLAPASVCADTLVKTDGSRLEGRVISEDASTVVFEAHAGGITMKQKIARAKVRSIERVVREGPGYCAIPLFGAVGEEVTAEAFEAALKAARQSKPRYIVLVIDSPGGLIADMARIVRLIDANRGDVEFVAYVRGQALSAAAIVALACPKIYLSPDATVGAAVPYQVGADGTPQAIEAKMQSAILAQMRAAARIGGHDELWARAMTEMDLTLAVKSDEFGRITLTTERDDAAARTIKRSDQILSLTASEAVSYGLGAGVVDGPASVGRAMGLTAWHVADERPWFVMAGRAQSVKEERRHEEAKADRVLEREKYIHRVLPEIKSIDAQLEAAMARARKAAEMSQKLRAEYTSQFDAAKAEYEANVKKVSHAYNGAHQAAKLREAYVARAKALEEKYVGPVAEHDAAYDKAAAEVQQLNARRMTLIASAPAVD